MFSAKACHGPPLLRRSNAWPQGSPGEGHCLNPQPLPPFCAYEPEPLPPVIVEPPGDAGKPDGEGGPDAGAD